MYHRLKDEIGIDQARKCLPLGFFSYGFLQLPFQTAIGIIKEVKERESYMPEEIKIFSKKLLEILYNISPSITEASLKLPYNTSYPHTNIFSSTTLEPIKTEIEILNFEAYELKVPERLKRKPNIASLEDIKELSKEWKMFVDEAKEKIYAKIKMPVSLAVYNELKRHRTAGIQVESIYSASERALNSFEKEDNTWLFVPKNLKSEDKKEWIELAMDQLSLYEKMSKSGIGRQEALYVIPHSLKVVVMISLNGYHLFDPFGFIGVRSCSTADIEFVEKTNLLINKLYKISPELASLMGPKCKLGYCPERSFCKIIKKYNPDYDEMLHQKINDMLS